MDKIRQGQEWMKTIKIFLGRASDAWRIRITVGDQSLGPQLILNCTTLSLYLTVPHPISTQLYHTQFILNWFTLNSYLILPRLIFTLLECTTLNFYSCVPHHFYHSDTLFLYWSEPKIFHLVCTKLHVPRHHNAVLNTFIQRYHHKSLQPSQNIPNALYRLG